MGDNNKKVIIEFKELPHNCTECPFYIDVYDEDACWGSGIVNYCFFGASHIGAHIERPEGCPIGTTIILPPKQNYDDDDNYYWEG